MVVNLSVSGVITSRPGLPIAVQEVCVGLTLAINRKRFHLSPCFLFYLLSSTSPYPPLHIHLSVSTSPYLRKVEVGLAEPVQGVDVVTARLGQLVDDVMVVHLQRHDL